jgi:hypothetical protein
MREAATTDGETPGGLAHGSPDLHDTRSTMPKVHSNDEYQYERRRIVTAGRWNDIQNIFCWGGVVFPAFMPLQWFNVGKVNKSDWSVIVQELQSVRDKFVSVIWLRIPEWAPVLLSTEISGCLIHFVVLTA